MVWLTPLPRTSGKTCTTKTATTRLVSAEEAKPTVRNSQAVLPSGVQPTSSGAASASSALSRPELTAITLLMERKIPLVVFNLKKPGNIVRVLQGEAVGTKITPTAK